MNTLQELQLATIAHTDAGDCLVVDGRPQQEFLVQGTIVKERSGLFFLHIEGNKFTTHKIRGFLVGEEVVCVVQFFVKEGKAQFFVRGLEKL